MEIDMAHLRTREMVDVYGIPEGTLRWWRSTERGPRSFKLGRTVFYDENDVAAWIASEKTKTAKGGMLR
jgi:predicted DNA-binding transcriptional regulator AlpA